MIVLSVLRAIAVPIFVFYAVEVGSPLKAVDRLLKEKTQQLHRLRRREMSLQNCPFYHT